ncbi:hypothetical protein BKA62DRAFT_619997, partial [Auriculariales sp. MPI-PUGE-AT-0066]
PLEYHLYTATLPPRMTTDATRHHIQGYFMSDATRDMLLRRAQLSRAAPPPGTAGNLPEEVTGYHSLVPLESLGPERRRTFAQYHGSLYRAVKTADGLSYALRRIEGYRLTHEAAFTALEPWTRIHHPNIVSIREGFTTRAFNDESLVLVYDHHADSQTLFERFMRLSLAGQGHAHTHGHGRTRRGHSQSLQLDQFMPEATLWSIIVQVSLAIRHAHDRGLAIRVVDVNKVIVNGKNRVRIGTCGALDMLAYGTPQNVQLLQDEDLIHLARLIVQLASNNISAMNILQKAVETVNRIYSPDVHKAIAFLLQPLTRLNGKTINAFLDSISTHVHDELEGAYDYADSLESDLGSELENGRLVRLLCKFGFINERPEFDYDPRWSDTGERYTVKLFRDYVFHQQDERGRPVVNLAHVVTCLNKLDAGSDERILLVGREEQNCLVVTYKEVKACIESAFGSVLHAAIFATVLMSFIVISPVLASAIIRPLPARSHNPHHNYVGNLDLHISIRHKRHSLLVQLPSSRSFQFVQSRHVTTSPSMTLIPREKPLQICKNSRNVPLRITTLDIVCACPF